MCVCVLRPRKRTPRRIAGDRRGTGRGRRRDIARTYGMRQRSHLDRRHRPGRIGVGGQTHTRIWPGCLVREGHEKVTRFLAVIVVVGQLLSTSTASLPFRSQSKQLCRLIPLFSHHSWLLPLVISSRSLPSVKRDPFATLKSESVIPSFVSNRA